MSKAIEQAVAALTEFESHLDAAKAEAVEAKARMLKDAGEWALSAKGKAVAKAQEIAARTIADARTQAGKEAAEINKKGEVALKKYEEGMQKHKPDAVELVAKRLLGESQ